MATGRCRAVPGVSLSVHYRDGAPRSTVSRENEAVRAFHRRLPSYEVTALRDAPLAAAALGVDRVLVKDESARLGLPSFKMLGASWATYRALVERLGHEPRWSTIGELAAAMRPLAPVELTTATDGNHGRAVARMAALLGLGARIYVPATMTAARREAIAAEGATVVCVAGTYDDAVVAAARDAQVPHRLVVSDTSWPGYERIPGWVVEGYATIFAEIEEQLGGAAVDLVAVPVGVGALAAAAVRHFRRPGAMPAVRLVSVEPQGAACVLAAVRAGRIVDVPGPHPSIMAGLNCGRASLVAWPEVSSGFDAYVAIGDDAARGAVRILAADGIVSGESGAAGLGGLLGLVSAPDACEHRRRLAIERGRTVLVISTEGATDPAGWTDIVGRPPPVPC